MKKFLIKFLNNHYNLKSFIKKIIVFKNIIFVNYLYNIFFGKIKKNNVLEKEVEHIWPSSNYSKRSIFLYWLIDKPLAKRGIFLPRHETMKNIDLNEFKTYNDEHFVIDKILNELNLNINEIFFVDLGAGDGIDMSNTYLLAARGAKGISIEFNPSKFAMMAVTYRDLPNILLSKCKVTPLNICSLITGMGAPSKIDILNLDIDSYDYYVLEVLLNKFEFSILVLEINPIFPIEIDFTVKYPSNEWTGSNFQGMSLSIAFKLLTRNKYKVVHIYKASIVAVKSDLPLSSFCPIRKYDLHSIFENSLRKYHNLTISRFRGKPVDELLILFKEEFKNHETSSYLLEKSGL
jgi:hypothetical protein